MLDKGNHRAGGKFAERTETFPLNITGYTLEHFQVPGRAVPVIDAMEQLVQPEGPFPARRTFAARLMLEEVELYGALVHVVAPNVRKQERAIKHELESAGIRPGSMSVIEPSLEDVFISAMKK